MKHLWIGSLACWLTIAFAADPVTPEQFEWRQPIRIDTRGDAIQRFELPRSAYTGSRRQDLGDIRIFNGSGQVVPHALLNYEPPAIAEAKQVPLAFFPLRRDGTRSDGQLDIAVRQIAGGALVSTQIKSAGPATSRLEGYVLDASSIKAARQAVILDWQPQPGGTVLPVRVDASDDLQTWRQISSGTQLVDLRSGDQRLQHNRIDLAGNPSKYFRIRWPEGHKGIILSSAAIQTSATAIRPSRLQWISAGAVQAGAAPGDFLFDSAGLPVESIRLRLPERNTVVPVRIHHRRADREPWREAASTVVYRLVQGNEEVLSPSIPLCCSTDRYWRLSFDQRGGGIGQGSPEVELGWVAQQGIFVARGTGPFLLAYGNASIAPAAFPAATLVPGYRPEQYPTLPEAVFDAPLERIAPTGAVSGDRVLNWRSIGLWTVLVVGVMALAAMVWRLLRQMDRGQG